MDYIKTKRLIEVVKYHYYNVEMTLFNSFDWIIVVFCLIGAIWGAIKGFIEEFTQKTGYIAGVVFALMFTKSSTTFFEKNFDLPLWLCSLSSYIVIFLLAYLLVKMTGNILKKITEKAGITAVDNFLGFFLGLIEFFIIISIVSILLTFQSLIDNSAVSNSYIYIRIISPLFDLVSGQIKDIA